MRAVYAQQLSERNNERLPYEGLDAEPKLRNTDIEAGRLVESARFNFCGPAPSSGRPTSSSDKTLSSKPIEGSWAHPLTRVPLSELTGSRGQDLAEQTVW